MSELRKTEGDVVSNSGERKMTRRGFFRDAVLRSFVVGGYVANKVLEASPTARESAQKVVEDFAKSPTGVAVDSALEDIGTAVNSAKKSNPGKVVAELASDIENGLDSIDKGIANSKQGKAVDLAIKQIEAKKDEFEKEIRSVLGTDTDTLGEIPNGPKQDSLDANGK